MSQVDLEALEVEIARLREGWNAERNLNASATMREAALLAEVRAGREEVKLYRLFVLAAHWVISGLHGDIEASEPAVLRYMPLRLAARRALAAFQPPGTVRNFTGAEGFALRELDEATKAIAPVPHRPLAGEAAEWWQAALKSLDLPSIPFGETMDYLRRALASPSVPQPQEKVQEAGYCGATSSWGHICVKPVGHDGDHANDNDIQWDPAPPVLGAAQEDKAFQEWVETPQSHGGFHDDEYRVAAAPAKAALKEGAEAGLHCRADPARCREAFCACQCKRCREAYFSTPPAPPAPPAAPAPRRRQCSFCNTSTDIEGVQIYSCEKCERECCTAHSDNGPGQTLFCEQCIAADPSIVSPDATTGKAE